MNFQNLPALNKYICKKISSTYPGLQFIMLSGSIIRKQQTKYSDIDYTACTLQKPPTGRFKFELVTFQGQVTLISVFFHTLSELLPPKAEVSEEYFLWIKQMMPNTKLVYGDRKLYSQVIKFCEELDYKRDLDNKTINKSTGKLLELLNRIKGFRTKNNDTLVYYYGRKLSEHAKRIVLEFNKPLSVRSESYYLSTIFSLANLPQDFAELYLSVERLTNSEIQIDHYVEDCSKLVKTTIKFLSENNQALDSDTRELISSDLILDFLAIH